MQLTDVHLLSDVGGRGVTLTWTVTYVAGFISVMVLLLSASGIHALMSCKMAMARTRLGGELVARSIASENHRTASRASRNCGNVMSSFNFSKTTSTRRPTFASV